MGKANVLKKEARKNTREQLKIKKKDSEIGMSAHLISCLILTTSDRVDE
jgi:hypothetical protein